MSPTTTPDSRRLRAATLALAAALLAAVSWFALASPFQADAQAGKPNVVFILTDDQTLEEMRALPATQTLIGARGTTFRRAYASFPLCCPSRAAILSGQYMHNNDVRGNAPPKGGWTKFADNGGEQKALPTWLDAAGYHNVMVGKYMNGYGWIDAPVPPGWDEWYGKVSEYDENVYGYGIYFNYHLREDGPAANPIDCENPVLPPGAPGDPYTCRYGQDDDDYQTDVFTERAEDAIRRVAGNADPFFMAVNYNAPHSPYIPAPRHAGSYGGVGVTKVGGLNEKNVRDKPRFIRRLPKINKNALKKIANRRRARLEMLRSVDEGVARIVDALDDEGELDDTYLIFTSDNGYFAGEHRIRQGKYLPHESSSHIPMLIAGPGIPAGGTSNELVSNVDIAATVADAAGVSPPTTQDGRSMLPFAAQPGITSGRPLVLEGDTGSIDDDGAEDPNGIGFDPADHKRLKAFYKKRKAKKRKLRKRCRRLKRIAPKRVKVCFKRGVSNLEQEPTDKGYKLRAPAYVGLRSNRYALHLYATGEVELYDMFKDPAQVNGVQRNWRYKRARKWMLAKLGDYASCKGNACLSALGPDPGPAKKKKKKKKKKRRTGR